MNNFQEKYIKQVIPVLKQEFGFVNDLAVPRMQKVTINVGISATKKDDAFTELIERTLVRITGQKPVFTKAKKAISAFKIREGNIVGAKVTLRRDKMYDFVSKLVNITFPRIRDFRGIDLSSVDSHGNFCYGFKEHLVFGEINPDEVEHIHGLEVIITTTASNKDQGLALFKGLGFPFKKDNQKNN